MSAPFASQRGLFSLPEGCHYLNCAYMSPLARTVEAAAHQGLERRRFPAGISQDDFFSPVQSVKASFAELMQVKPESVALVPSVSYAMAIATRNLDVPAGSEIVVAGELFPSNYYAWSKKAQERGAKLHVVDAPDEIEHRGRVWSEHILDAIHRQTSIVSLPKVHWSDGTLFDLERIAQRCRDVDAALVLDLTQSAGAMQHDLEELKPAMAVCATYKTLFGPYGTAFAHFSDEMCQGSPLEETWIARRGSEDFARLVDYQEEYRQGAERFDVGQRSSPVIVPMLQAALDMVASWGTENVQNYARRLLEPWLPELDRMACRLAGSGARAEHLIGIRPPGGTDLERLRAELAERRVYVSIRGDAVRVSIHVFNEDADIEALVSALAASL